MQHKAVYVLFCKFILHVSGVNNTHHQEYTKLLLQSPVLVIYFVQLPSSSVGKLRTLVCVASRCAIINIYLR